MYVAAFTDEYGFFEKKDSFVNTKTTIYRNGNITKSQVAKLRTTDTAGRYTHSINVPKDIGGGVMFRSPSPYIRGVVKTEWTSGSYEREYPTGSIAKVIDEGYPYLSGSATGTGLEPFFNPAYVTVDLNQVHMLEVEVLNKLGNQRAALGTALAEAAATADMLALRSKELLWALRAAKQRDWRQVWNRLGLPTKQMPTRSPANLYKEWHYGWQPLMKDISDIYSLLRDRLEPAFIMSAKQSCTDEYHNSGELVSGCVSELNATRFHTVKLWAKLDSSRARAANQIGLANPLAIGWELVPYSFVVDWAVPVGNVLAALTATNGLTFIGGYYCVGGSGTATSTQNCPSGWSEVGAKSVSVERCGYKRVPYGEFPKPVLYAKSPFSTSHVLSALALFQSKTGLR